MTSRRSRGFSLSLGLGKSSSGTEGGRQRSGSWFAKRKSGDNFAQLDEEEEQSGEKHKQADGEEVPFVVTCKINPSRTQDMWNHEAQLFLKPSGIFVSSTVDASQCLVLYTWSGIKSWRSKESAFDLQWAPKDDTDAGGLVRFETDEALRINDAVNEYVKVHVDEIKAAQADELPKEEHEKRVYVWNE